jgi:hypothetical protein
LRHGSKYAAEPRAFRFREGRLAAELVQRTF